MAVDQRRIWKIEAESAARHSGRAFPKRDTAEQVPLLGMMHRRALSHPAWEGVGTNAFFTKRILSDIPCLYYNHLPAWSEMVFGGPANPHGYVRMELDWRDPWEAAEARPVVKPALTIQTIAMRTASGIGITAERGEL